MKIAMVLCCVAIAGCATPEQQAAQRQAYGERLQNQCRAYGFQPGTDVFAQCMMRLDQQNQSAQQAAIRQQQQMIRAQQESADRQYQIQMQQLNQQQYRPAVNTTCTTNLGITNCTTR